MAEQEQQQGQGQAQEQEQRQTQVTVRRHFGRQAVAVVTGGVIAGCAAPVILPFALAATAGTALAGYAAFATCVASAAVGGAATQGISDVISADPTVLVQYNAHMAQGRFRQAVSQYLQAAFNSAILAVRSNAHLLINRDLMVTENVAAAVLGTDMARRFGIRIKFKITVIRTDSDRTFEKQSGSTGPAHICRRSSDSVPDPSAR